jgi:nucleoside-diphosphate-sugar epimerase
MTNITIASETELLDQMTTPTPEVEAAVARLDGEILLLGVGGKMGPSLAELLVRAGAQKVIGVSRFSDLEQRRYLEGIGVETIACDLLDAAALKQLPDAPNVFLLAGFKFGATGNEDTTWAMNTWLPGRVLECYADARIIYVSSGNVYAYADRQGLGAAEDGALDPVGEYAQSRLGGERVASYAARVQGTRLLIVRLFYATELRYGIIHDIAWKVWTKEPIDLTMGYVNQLWQGDANAYLCRFFPLCESPAAVINLTGPEILAVRGLAEELGLMMDREPRFVGTEAADALLGDTRRLGAEFGAPAIGPEQMVRWVAEWVMADGYSLGKPTKYESRSGQF